MAWKRLSATRVGSAIVVLARSRALSASRPVISGTTAATGSSSRNGLCQARIAAPRTTASTIVAAWNSDSMLLRNCPLSWTSTVSSSACSGRS